jgi:hypothetical protein
MMSLISPARISENFSVKMTSVARTRDFCLVMNASTLDVRMELLSLERVQRNLSTLELNTRRLICYQICLEFTSVFENLKLNYASWFESSLCSIVFNRPSSPKYCSRISFDIGLGVSALKRKP